MAIRAVCFELLEEINMSEINLEWLSQQWHRARESFEKAEVAYYSGLFSFSTEEINALRERMIELEAKALDAHAIYVSASNTD
jgi:hypothetical protein